MNFSNQQTEIVKLITRMKTAPIPELRHPFLMDMHKKSLDTRAGMPQRREIKIKIKIPKQNQTSTHTPCIYSERLSATNRPKVIESEAESCLLRTSY
jgi:hypothetical protein